MTEFKVGDRVVWLGMAGGSGYQSDFPEPGTLGTVTEINAGRIYSLRVHFDDFLTSTEHAGSPGALVALNEVEKV